jgi:hypothetical protein
MTDDEPHAIGHKLFCCCRRLLRVAEVVDEYRDQRFP